LPSTSDASLVARVLAGDDRHAFAELVRRHQSAVRGLLRRLTAGDAALADDLAQQVFVTAWRKLGSWRGQASLSTWLHRIAFNAWASRARAAPPVEPPPPEPRRATDDAVLEHRDLARALGTLRPEERTALAVTYGQELTHEEAAELLGCPVGTLKTNILRGKEKLRRLLVPAPEGAP
jgi:RNA polymerase sigma-70 factor (ECF subfamily)